MNRLAFGLLTLIACSTDTFVSPDSGSDAASDAIGPPTDGGCQKAPACAANQVCLDFDQSALYAPFIDVSKNGGKVEISSDQFVTCPHSMLSTVGLATATTLPVGAIATAAPIGSTSSAQAHLEADIFLPTTTTGAAMYLDLAANADVNSVVALAVTLNGDWVLYVQASTNAVPIFPRVGAWNHFVLDVTFSSSGGSGHASLAFTDHNGDPKTADINDSTLPGSTSTITQVAAGVGIQTTTVSTATVSAYYDDISFGAQ